MGAALASGGAQAQGRDHVGAKAPRNAWRLWFPPRQAGPRAHRRACLAGGFMLSSIRPRRGCAGGVGGHSADAVEGLMRGRVLGFDGSTGKGVILGEDGVHYSIVGGSLRVGVRRLHEGQDVEFLPGADDVAWEVGPTPRGRNRIVAAMLAMFLGVLGAHKFYLGRYGTGFAMLVAFIGGMAMNGSFPWLYFILGPLPAGIIGTFGLIVSSGIALVSIAEATVYITRTDEEFHEKYVKRQEQTTLPRKDGSPSLR